MIADLSALIGDPVQAEHLALVPIHEICPSPENDNLYAKVDPSSPSFLSFIDSIREHGIREPLVITSDRVLVSGHRRLLAAKVIAMLTSSKRPVVPCRILDRPREDYTTDEWVVLLREHNRSRVKTLDEVIREEAVSADPEAAYKALLEQREKRRLPKIGHVPLREDKERKTISAAKDEFADAVVRVLAEMREGGFLPISLRRIHYLLLNDPPLTHASKPESRYSNMPANCKKLCDLVIRMRFENRLSWGDINDTTRPQKVWTSFRNVQEFIHSEMDELFDGYWRNLLQSQPDHIELVVEKNSVEGVLSSIASQYTMILTSGRGDCSGRPRYDMAKRLIRSGKNRLVLLLVSDHDPDGDEISHSFARSMRDKFNIDEVVAHRVALTPLQVQRFSLVPGGKAKIGSSSYDRYVAEHGHDIIYELEALPPADLQVELTRAIESVLDLDILNAEIAKEKKEAAGLSVHKNAVLRFLKEGRS